MIFKKLAEEAQDVPEIFTGEFTNKEFLTYGLDDMAYVRPVQIDGVMAYAVYGADGTPLAVQKTYDEAAVIISRNGMDVSILH
ncbi:MAG: hypothetical protein ACRBCT_10190 [Alphaproteobacteria bacterium]